MPSNYDGIFVLGDIHADIDKFRRSIEYANVNNLFPILLGDLIDGGKNPYETITMAYKLLEADKAVMIIGNHDYKWKKVCIDEKAYTPTYMINTIYDVPEGKEYSFLDMVEAIPDHRNCYYHVQCGKFHLSHASVDHSLLNDGKCDKIDGMSDEMLRELKWKCMFGEYSTRRDYRGYPIRTYHWVDSIPSGKVAVVGHDRSPFGKKFDGRPYMASGDLGGMAIFLDTSCGKRDDGILTGLELRGDSEYGLEFSKFVYFGET